MNIFHTPSKEDVPEDRISQLSEIDTSKFVRVTRIISNWMEPYGGLAGKRVLDFGCGGGKTAAGVALQFDADVHGVDINAEAAECEMFLKEALGIAAPPQLSFAQIHPGQPIEGGPFDLIYSWSVFEHVNNRIYADVLADLYKTLKPGGYFFMQISPLYFSPEGSHLWAIGYKTWEHLFAQTSDVHQDIQNAPLADQEKRHLTGMFDTLNRVTVEDLMERFGLAGFKIIRQQRDKVADEPPEALLRAYQREALTTFQIVALFQKPE